MKKLYLPQRQIGAEVVRVMMNPQPFYDGRSRRHEWDARGQIGVVDIKDAAKYGPFLPGEIVYVPETWKPVASGQLVNGTGDIRYGVAFKDGTVDWRESTTKVCDISDGTTKSPMQFRENKWRTASTLSSSGARHFALIIEVKAARVQEVTEEEAKQSKAPLVMWYMRPGPEDEWISYGGMKPSHKNGFANEWQKRYPGSWERNDWTWVLRLEWVDREGRKI